MLGQTVSYTPASWMLQEGAFQQDSLPTHRIELGRFPTPYHHFNIPGLEDLQLECFIKRDDLTSFDLSGNKVRKLEFLLADAKSKKCDTVITIGGMQSNHCRATAVATRQIGLEPVLLLRKPDYALDVPISLTGNLFFDRMVDTKIYTIPTSKYAKFGEKVLGEELAQQLTSQGKSPYLIPVGGSNRLGAFGYMECVRELIEDFPDADHVVFACGSGGTAAGIAIGAKLSGWKAQIHAVGVCDNPDYFYNHIDEVARSYNIDYNRFGTPRTWCNIYSGEGRGYAKSTDDELKYLFEVSRKTGIVLDPVYSGKALYHFVHHVVKSVPTIFSPGQKVVFIHTGGTFGFYDKVDQLQPLLPSDQERSLELSIN